MYKVHFVDLAVDFFLFVIISCRPDPCDAGTDADANADATRSKQGIQGRKKAANSID